jgi:hypothetical protein
MISFPRSTFNFRIIPKAFFFDAPRVLAATDRATNIYLGRAGGFVKVTASRSMRRRKKSSAPGDPPSAHEGTLKERLFYAYESDRRSVVIGPEKTNQVFFDGDGRPVRGTVPEILERGGSIHIRQVFKGGEWKRADLRSRRRNAGLPTRLHKVTIVPRPYMQPALDAALPRMPGWWAEAFRRTAGRAG